MITKDMVLEAAKSADEEKWGVFLKGGSIGGKKDEPMKVHPSKKEAQEHAKRLRKQLTPGEKSYYKMGYTVKEIK